MDYFQDILVQPNAEIRQNVLLSKAYIKLHNVLKDIKPFRIGVSFPNYKTTLGNTIRLHGCETNLSKLQGSNWLDELTDYCQVSKIEVTPKIGIKHRTVSRWQSNMGKSQLRRLIKRGSISETGTQNYRAKMMQSQLTNLPYLEVKSESNGHWYRRYIQMGELTDVPATGEFDSFGLSKQATIPWF